MNDSIKQKLTRATCAVWVNDEREGTAWLVDDEGHLLTAAHVLGREDPRQATPKPTVKVKFDGDSNSYPVTIEEWKYEKKGIETKTDFAVLHLKTIPDNRSPLLISTTTTLKKNDVILLRGYSKLEGQLSGKACFIENYNSKSDIFIFCDSFNEPSISVGGFSGGAIFSQSLNRVVAIYIGEIRGSGRTMALSLYHISNNGWEKLRKLKDKGIYLRKDIINDINQTDDLNLLTDYFFEILQDMPSLQDGTKLKEIQHEFSDYRQLEIEEFIGMVINSTSYNKDEEQGYISPLNIFMEKLKELDEVKKGLNPTLEEALKALRKKYHELHSRIKVKVAVIAMTETQAEWLQNYENTKIEDILEQFKAEFWNCSFPEAEDVLQKFIRNIEGKRLQKLKAALQDSINITSCYKSKPIEWQPLDDDQNKSIKEIVQAAQAKLNLVLKKKPPILFDFISEQFLSKDETIRHQAWNDFEMDGGVLIVDAISLYHPEIRRYFLNSQLITPRKDIAMIVIVPQVGTKNSRGFKKMFELYTLRTYLMDTHIYNFGRTNDDEDIKKWLIEVVKVIKKDYLELDPTKIKNKRLEMAERITHHYNEYRNYLKMRGVDTRRLIRPADALSSN
ncbi:serine protease [Anaerolineales bacterium HSG6]|nr:serine protease [Anaerolineales bacterium HSG6]